jgi:DNA repair exonuclease SbcCD ATPase subunit
MLFVPTADASDAEKGVGALLAVIADPKKFQAKYEEFTKAAAESRQALKELHDAQRDAAERNDRELALLEAAKRESDASAEKAVKERVEADAALARMHGDAARKMEDLARDREALTLAKHEHAQRVMAFDAAANDRDERQAARDRALQEREQRVEKLQAEAKRDAEEAAAFKSTYEKKLAALRAMAS